MLKWILLGAGSLTFLITVGLSVMLVMNPPEVPADESAVEMVQPADPVAADSSHGEPETEMEKLQRELDEQIGLADSLQQKLEGVQAELEKKQTLLASQYEKLETLETLQGNAKDMAKTFESMKTNEMKPILSSMNDAAVEVIYQHMSGRSRKKLLLGLSEQRAARLAQRFVPAREEQGGGN